MKKSQMTVLVRHHTTIAILPVVCAKLQLLVNDGGGSSWPYILRLYASRLSTNRATDQLSIDQIAHECIEALKGGRRGKNEC